MQEPLSFVGVSWYLADLTVDIVCTNIIVFCTLILCRGDYLKKSQERASG